MPFCNICGKQIPEVTDTGIWSNYRETCDTCPVYPYNEGDKIAFYKRDLFCPKCGKVLKFGTSESGKRRRICFECKPTKKVYTSENHRVAARVWQERNPNKTKAQRYARYHRDKLTILRECLHDDLTKQNHHPDYSKPLEVERLCYWCHRDAHKRSRTVV